MGGLSAAEKKNIISDKLTNIFLTIEDLPQSEEHYKGIIIKQLSEEQKNYLEDGQIKNYFDEISSKFYKKLKEVNEERQSIRNSINSVYDNILKNEKKMENLKNSISKENSQKQKEYIKKLENKLEEFNNKIKEIENKNNEEKERIRFNNDILQAEVKSTIEFLERKMRDEKEEEKRKKYEKELQEAKEKEKKKEELNVIFKEKVEKIKSNKFSEIEKEFDSNKTNFCYEEISKFDKSEINLFIKNFLKTEKVAKIILDFLIQLVSLNKKIIKNIEHLNIVLVGPSGVGKSTLINAILDVDIKTGFGCPQTRDSEFFNSEKIPFIRLADSRGVEKNNTSGIDSIFENIKNFIQSQLNTNDYDKFIHIIWYCWTGTRFEQSEIELFKKISEQYSLNNIPVIIVYTNAIFPKEIENAKKYIKEDLKLENEFIDVLALEKELDGKIIKARNLDKLIQKSVELAKSAIKSSIYEGLIKEIKNKINGSINSIMIKLKDKINYEVKVYMEKKGENINLRDFHDNTKNIILNTLYKYFILTPDNEKEIKIDEIPKITIGNKEFSFSEESMNILNEFCFNYFDKILKIYLKNLDEFLNKYSEKLAQEIRIAKLELNSKNENLLSESLLDSEYESVLKNDLIQKLQKKAQFTVLSNSFIFIIEPLIEKIGEYFNSLYQQLMTHENFINSARTAIQDSFSEIENKIKNYNELLKAKKEKEKGDLENENKGAAPSQTAQNSSALMNDVNDLINDI